VGCVVMSCAFYENVYVLIMNDVLEDFRLFIEFRESRSHVH